MWFVLNSIPIIGHVKGVLHYAVGDVEGGNRAMRDAGALGILVGPVGAAGLGIAVGAAWDAVESVATGEGKGIVANIESIINTATEGDLPVSGILQTSLIIAGDALGGLGGGSVARSTMSTASKLVVEETTTAVIREETAIIASYVLTRTAVIEIVKQLNTSSDPPCDLPRDHRNSRLSNPSELSQGSQNSSRTNSQSHESNIGGSGQQPARGNTRNTPTTLQQECHWQAFLELFSVQFMDEINIRGRYIFQNLSYPKTDLKNLIVLLRRKGILRRVIETILNIFNAMDLNDITYENFMSLAEFTMQYLKEQMARRNELDRMKQETPATFNERRNEIIEVVCTEIQQHDYTILRVFQEIRSHIELQSLPVNFLNIYAGVCHYYRHRCVGSTELSVEQFYDIIISNLEIIMNIEPYIDMINAGEDVTYERYYECFGRRLIIVIKKQGDCVVLSDCFFGL